MIIGEGPWSVIPANVSNKGDRTIRWLTLAPLSNLNPSGGDQPCWVPYYD